MFCHKLLIGLYLPTYLLELPTESWTICPRIGILIDLIFLFAEDEKLKSAEYPL